MLVDLGYLHIICITWLLVQQETHMLRVEGIILVYHYSLREEGTKVTLVGQSSVAQFPALGPSPFSGALFTVEC